MAYIPLYPGLSTEADEAPRAKKAPRESRRLSAPAASGFVVASLAPHGGSGRMREDDILASKGDLREPGYIASNTKPMVTLTLLRLHDEGLIKKPEKELLRTYMTASHADLGSVMAARALRDMGKLSNAEVRRVEASVSSDPHEHGMKKIPELRDKIDRLFSPYMHGVARDIGIKVAKDVNDDYSSGARFTNVSGAYWGGGRPTSRASMTDMVRIYRALYARDDGATMRSLGKPSNAGHTTQNYPGLARNPNVFFAKTGTIYNKHFEPGMKRQVGGHDVAVLTIGYYDNKGQPNMVFFRTGSKEARVKLASQFQDKLMSHEPASRAVASATPSRPKPAA